MRTVSRRRRRAWVLAVCLPALAALAAPRSVNPGAAPPHRAPAIHAQADAAARYRTLNDRFLVRRYRSLEEWQERAAVLRERLLASAGLLPMPERAPLNAVVFGERRHQDYTVSKVYFESLPGFYVTGNLYKPIGEGPFPAVLSAHGHWWHGRFEHSELASVPGRAITLARLGFVVFSYDMVGYNDSRQLAHTPSHTGHERPFGGRRENLWGLSLAGLQLWNSIRAVDFLESLPDVARDRIGATGASGGGTQTFLLAAADERIAAAAPVNMISLHMQGGCLCENVPGLRLDTNNVELTALAAPRPLLMVSATGDWTRETLEVEYPEMRRFYALFDAADRVHAVRMDAGHNYNRDSREAVYAWLARWLQGAPPDVRIEERPFRPDPLPEVMVFHGRPLPDGAAGAEEFTRRWIAAARRQLETADRQPFQAALLHALGFDRQIPPVPAPPPSRQVVLLATTDRAVERAVTRAGFVARPVRFTPFDAAAAAKVDHFETYNRTEASQRVADLVAALSDEPDAILIADGDAALAGVLAAAVIPIRQAILDVGGFDASCDEAFLERLYIPGVRRAGDLRTAAAMARGEIVVHNAGGRFEVSGVTVRRERLGAAEVVGVIRRGPN